MTNQPTLRKILVGVTAPTPLAKSERRFWYLSDRLRYTFSSQIFFAEISSRQRLEFSIRRYRLQLIQGLYHQL